MESVAVSIQDVINAATHERADQIDVDYFASDTSNCTLNCQKPSNDKQVAPTQNTLPVLSWYYILSTNLSHRHRKAPSFNTAPFQFDHVTLSAGRGCRGCKFLSLLLSGMFEAYPEFTPDNTQLRWTGAQFTIEVTPKNESPRHVQFFYPRGWLV